MKVWREISGYTTIAGITKSAYWGRRDLTLPSPEDIIVSKNIHFISDIAKSCEVNKELVEESFLDKWNIRHRLKKEEVTEFLFDWGSP